MSYKVLIVEDDPMVAMINEQYVLKNNRFSIAGTCRNGKEAITFLENNSVNLILMDVFMPVMDGIETLKRLREKNVTSEVIMVTAANDTSTIDNTMHLGVLDYLIKPFVYERFNVSLEKFISKTEIFKDHQVLDQKSLDNLISNNNSQPETALNKYPKGIQQKTLSMIQAYFEENPAWHTVDLVAEELGISIVTVRNYLNYLVQSKVISEDINYSTGGRPGMLYKINK